MTNVQIFDDEKLYTQTEAAPIFGKSRFWFERARWAGTGPEFIKIGRSVRYTGRALNEFLSSGTRGSTTGDVA